MADLRNAEAKDLVNLRIVDVDLGNPLGMTLTLSDGRRVSFYPEVADPAKHDLPEGDPIVTTLTRDETPKQRLVNYDNAKRRQAKTANDVGHDYAGSESGNDPTELEMF